nr:ribonuclease H-like domain-containing protein [Tanacetum cinerariifolium]
MGLDKQISSVDLLSTPGEENVKIVYVHLFDKALLWHRQLIKSKGENVTWIEYKKAITLRFGSVFDDPIAALKNAKIKPNIPPRKQLTQKEYEEKRYKNLCVYCDKKYVPGHKCNGQLYSLVLLPNPEEEEDEEFLDANESLGDSLNEEVQAHISLNALSGVSYFQTMRLTRYNNCTIEFNACGFSVKDFLTRHILIRCDSSDDLYPVTKSSTLSAAFVSTSSTTWHQRLGHIRDEVLRSLSSRQFISCNKAKSTHVCHACQLGKHVKPPFHSSNSLVKQCFDIIHSDLWTSPLSIQRIHSLEYGVSSILLINTVYEQTIKEYMAQIRDDIGPGIVMPTFGDAVCLELKVHFLKELYENTFGGTENKDDNENIAKVLDIVDLFYEPGVNEHQLMLCVFPATLTGQTFWWLKTLPTGSITTWSSLKTRFLHKYCQPSKTAKKMEEIKIFKQEPHEKLYRAWERFDYLLLKCTQHELTDIQTILKCGMKEHRIGKEFMELKEEAPIPKVVVAPYQPPIPSTSRHLEDLLKNKSRIDDKEKAKKNECALTDLGATVSFMPYTIFTCLGLGRRFLSTSHAKIDVFEKKISLRVRKDKIVFKDDKLVTNTREHVYSLKTFDALGNGKFSGFTKRALIDEYLFTNEIVVHMSDANLLFMSPMLKDDEIRDLNMDAFSYESPFCEQAKRENEVFRNKESEPKNVSPKPTESEEPDEEEEQYKPIDPCNSTFEKWYNVCNWSDKKVNKQNKLRNRLMWLDLYRFKSEIKRGLRNIDLKYLTRLENSKCECDLRSKHVNYCSFHIDGFVKDYLDEDRNFKE